MCKAPRLPAVAEEQKGWNPDESHAGNRNIRCHPRFSIYTLIYLNSQYIFDVLYLHLTEHLEIVSTHHGPGYTEGLIQVGQPFQVGLKKRT